MFWAEAVATEVRSVVTVMPVMRMPLTPRLKRVWRRTKKAKGSPELRTDDPPGAPLSLTFGGRRKYDLSAPGVRRLERVRNASARGTGLPPPLDAQIRGGCRSAQRHQGHCTEG